MPMPAKLQDSLHAAMLTERERRALERLVERPRQELGADLHAIWLYGSRARGDAVIDEADVDMHSDIDLLVLADDGDGHHGMRSIELVHEVAEAEGVKPTSGTSS